MTTGTMKRSEIRRILKRHRGEIAALAVQLQVSHPVVTFALKGGHGGRVGKDTESRILAAAEKRAIELSSSQINTERGIPPLKT